MAGLIFDDEGERMTPTHANKNGRRYRYYVTHSLIRRGRPKASEAARRVPAGEIERLVEERIICLFEDEAELHGAFAETAPQGHEIETLMANAAALAGRCPRMPSNERQGLLQSLVARVTVKSDGLEVRIHTAHLAKILRCGSRASNCEPLALPDEPTLVLKIAAPLKRTGMEKKLLIEGARNRSGAAVDASLLKLIARAHELHEMFIRGGRPISEMAAAAGLSSSYFTRMLRLSFLASDITRAMLHGRQPPELNAATLMADTRLPPDWDEQRAKLGFT